MDEKKDKGSLAGDVGGILAGVGGVGALSAGLSMINLKDRKIKEVADAHILNDTFLLPETHLTEGTLKEITGLKSTKGMDIVNINKYGPTGGDWQQGLNLFNDKFPPELNMGTGVYKVSPDKAAIYKAVTKHFADAKAQSKLRYFVDMYGDEAARALMNSVKVGLLTSIPMIIAVLIKRLGKEKVQRDLINPVVSENMNKAAADYADDVLLDKIAYNEDDADV